jgi:DNA-binding transcriptional LysR family regulator
VELYQIKSFIAVAEEGNLTRASMRLFASQPAVSAHIKSLEEELEVVLFERTRQGMRLTPEGEMLLPNAQRILDDARDFMNQAVSLRDELAGVARIGLNSSPNLLKITELVAAVTAAFPRLELHLIHSEANRVLKYLKNEKLDAGFYKGVIPAGGFQALPLTKVNMVVTGPIEFKDRMDTASIDDLAQMPWIWRTSDGPFMCFGSRLFSNECFSNTRVIVAEDDETMRSLLISGAGLQLMEENKARADASAGKVAVWPGDKVRTQLSFIYLATRQEDPIIESLCKVLRSVWGLKETNGEQVYTTDRSL